MGTGNSRDMLAILAGPGPEVFTTRPVIMGTHGMVTSGHYLASRIGLHILEEGGTRSMPGWRWVSPWRFWSRTSTASAARCPSSSTSRTRTGREPLRPGPAPQKATIDWFGKNGSTPFRRRVAGRPRPRRRLDLDLGAVPLRDHDPLPGPVPSVELAGRGFPMFERLRSALQRSSPQFQEQWPSSAHAYLPGGGFRPWGTLRAAGPCGFLYPAHRRGVPGKGRGAGMRLRPPAMPSIRGKSRDGS